MHDVHVVTEPHQRACARQIRPPPERAQLQAHSTSDGRMIEANGAGHVMRRTLTPALERSTKPRRMRAEAEARLRAPCQRYHPQGSPRAPQRPQCNSALVLGA